jgi:thymidine kinase
VANSRVLLELVETDAEVIGIDEGQFFDQELPAICNALADRGMRVIVAGLDQDYLGKPFEPMPQLLAIAEYITKTLAICMVCGNPANHTQRLVPSGDRVLLGASGTYEARCRVCFDPNPAPASTKPESQLVESRVSESRIPDPESRQR